MTSNTAKGTVYEKFVQSLYQTLCDAEGFENITVQHNKTDLVGNSGCAHQLDVYWEFRIAGKTYRTAIECKAFDNAVSIGRVRDFYGVLADVPGLQGMFVSLFGFQSGAKKYADHYGIDLKEIREPAIDDLDGRIENVHLRFFVATPEITSIKPDVTDEYLKSLKAGEEASIPFSGTTHGAFIVNGDGEHVTSIEEIRQNLPTDTQPATGLEETISFPHCFYNSSNGQRIPVDSVTVRYDVLVEVQHADIFGENAAKAIIKDVKSGELTVFHKDGAVHNPR